MEGISHDATPGKSFFRDGAVAGEGYGGWGAGITRRLQVFALAL
jgi:hypothetical protein